MLRRFSLTALCDQLESSKLTVASSSRNLPKTIAVPLYRAWVGGRISAKVAAKMATCFDLSCEHSVHKTQTCQRDIRTEMNNKRSAHLDKARLATCMHIAWTLSVHMATADVRLALKLMHTA